MKKFLLIIFCVFVSCACYSQSSVANCTDMQEKMKLIKAHFGSLVASFAGEEESKDGGVTEYTSTLEMCGSKATIRESDKVDRCTFSFTKFSSPGTDDEYKALFENAIKMLNKVFGDTHDINTVSTLADIKTYFMYEKGKTALTSKKTIVVQLSFMFGFILSIDFEYTK